MSDPCSNCNQRHAIYSDIIRTEQPDGTIKAFQTRTCICGTLLKPFEIVDWKGSWRKTPALVSKKSAYSLEDDESQAILKLYENGDTEHKITKVLGLSLGKVRYTIKKITDAKNKLLKEE